VTVNDVALTQRVLPSLGRAVGGEHVINVPLETGAEDFAYFAEKVPGFYFFVGATPRGQDLSTTPANHSPRFYVDESALQVGLRATLYIAVDYLQRGANNP
jgi:amidohydrolase